VTDANHIVFLDTVSPAIRKTLTDNVPPGFTMTFPEVDTPEKAALVARDADYLLIWAGYLPGSVIESATKARLIQKVGEGTDRIDVATATRMGIPVARTPGGNSVSVAEATTMLILAALRRLPQAHNSVLAGEWRKFGFRSYSYELRSKRVGIIGIGKIGRMVAAHVLGFGASVAYHDVRRLSTEEEERLGIQYLPFEELLRDSDVITLHVPLLPSTRNLIGHRELSLMKPTAVLVNSCRGAVVDEEALYEALKEHKILAAALDVFAKEPPGANHPLYSLDNVVLTPHNAGGTVDSEIALVRQAFANIVKVSRGEKLDPVDYAQPA